MGGGKWKSEYRRAVAIEAVSLWYPCLMLCWLLRYAPGASARTCLDVRGGTRNMWRCQSDLRQYGILGRVADLHLVAREDAVENDSRATAVKMKAPT